MRLPKRDRKHLRSLVRVAAVAAVALGASACSSVPNWAKPTTWYDDVAGHSNTVATDAQSYPEPANIPDKPTPSTTPVQRQEIANGLIADREHTQYSADALRGGTEPAAAPPPPASPQDLSKLDVPSAADTDTEAPSDASQAAPAEQPAAEQPAAEQPAAEQPAAEPSDKTSSAYPDYPAAEKTAEEEQPAPAPTRPVAMAAAQPAVPTMNAPGAIPGAQPAIPADAPLGFQPPNAPALDPSVAQFVPASVLARYRATQAAAAQVATPATAAAIPVPNATASKKKKTKRTADATPVTDTIVPAAYTPPDTQANDAGGGSVYVNLDAVKAGSNVVKTSATEGVIGSAAWRTPGLAPAGVVFFPGGVAINAAGMAQIHTVVDAYQASGSRGYVRVVGHSSSRTGNMPLADHIAYVFRQSQQHADVVAQALIREGIPANAIIVEAVGDTQPVYYESMPKGEEGNRRTEIFIEG